MLAFLLILIPFAAFLIAKLCFNHKFNFQEVVIGIIICAASAIAVLEVSKNGKMADREIWNGKVTSKQPEKRNCPVPDYDGWTDEYSSFCSAHDDEERIVGYETVCDSYNDSGSCTSSHEEPIYETYYRYYFRYEQRWYVNSNLVSWEEPRVGGRYKQGLKEPKSWTIVKINDPVSVTRPYDNYVRAVPESLFNNKEVKNAHSASVPAYPTVHGRYKVNRVLSVGYKGNIDKNKLNYELGKALGRLNPAKQVNVIVILTSIGDMSFRHAVENKWLGGKKNDAIIFISLDTNGDILWTDLMTFGKNKFNGIYTANLTGAISDMENITKDNQGELVGTIENLTAKHYDRPAMKEYFYLVKHIQPSTGALIFAFILDILICVGLLWAFNKYDFDPIGNSYRHIKWKFNRRRRFRR